MDAERSALERNDRYLLEFVEALNLCPFAKPCRETGKLLRQVITGPLDAAQIVAAVRQVEALPADSVEVALLILPDVQLEAKPFDRFVAEVRGIIDQGHPGPAPFFMVAFHPELTQDLRDPDRAVTFLRRSPDPTIQLVRSAAIYRARDAAGDARELSRKIAEAGLAAVLERGPERVAALLDEMRPRRTSSG